MCLNCIRKKRETFNEGREIAMKHLDECEVPSDSLLRGLAEVHLACNIDPLLRHLMREMYPDQATLTQ